MVSITNSHASLIPITELTEIYISPTKLFSRKDYQRLFQPQSTENTFNNNDPLIQEWIPKAKHYSLVYPLVQVHLLIKKRQLRYRHAMTG